MVTRTDARDRRGESLGQSAHSMSGKTKVRHDASLRSPSKVAPWGTSISNANVFVLIRAELRYNGTL
jgi:hypothetical protein